MIKIITGANDSYILTMIDFILSYKNLNSSPQTLIVYDLGLKHENIETLMKIQTQYNFIFKKIDYSLYPEYVDLNKFNGLYCSYAFKPIIIYNEANNIDNKNITLIWMDIANRFNIDALNQIYACVKKYGIYTPVSNINGSIETIELNHPKMIELFGLSPDEHTKLLNTVSANLIGMDYSNIVAKFIIDEWYHKSLIKEFIMPVGSSRNNHRQDQSVLSVIIYLYEKNNNVVFYKNSISGIFFWCKKDKSTIQPHYFPFTLFDKITHKQLAIIYCKNMNEAIETYAKRKLISIEMFNTKFIVSTQ
jgi:hypothetical protein